MKHIEIERKYKVNRNLWAKLDKPVGDRILQGFLSTDKKRTIRVRVRNKRGSLTIKGITTNISREEFEFPVPYDIAIAVIKKFASGVIEKIRYTIPFKGKDWEIDEFLGSNKGLIIAEVELKSEDEVVVLPEWVEKEVSDNARYYNVNLSTYPYEKWKDK